mmetsp:Transcript_33897/g.80461  ORF Transcript_33897/g.80461 Transcript_33897/m.80461 type:complete len:296 (-) Transcript_33897:657-1544(-)
MKDGPRALGDREAGRDGVERVRGRRRGHPCRGPCGKLLSALREEVRLGEGRLEALVREEADALPREGLEAGGGVAPPERADPAAREDVPRHREDRHRAGRRLNPQVRRLMADDAEGAHGGLGDGAREPAGEEVLPRAALPALGGLGQRPVHLDRDAHEVRGHDPEVPLVDGDQEDSHELLLGDPALLSLGGARALCLKGGGDLADAAVPDPPRDPPVPRAVSELHQSQEAPELSGADVPVAVHVDRVKRLLKDLPFPNDHGLKLVIVEPTLDLRKVILGETSCWNVQLPSKPSHL